MDFNGGLHGRELQRLVGNRAAENFLSVIQKENIKDVLFFEVISS